MNRRTIDILSRLLLFAVPVACSTLPIGTVTEPPVIIVRNSTGADLAKATLSEAAGGNRAFQYGSISPVPRGASQIFVRPTKPQKLPKTVNLEWIDDQGIRHSRELSLMKVLQTATGTKGEAIVFDIWPRGDVSVFLERSEAYTGKEIENIEWRLVDVDGRTISPSINEKWPYLKFDPAKKQTVGYTGCNNFFTGYTLEGASLTFGPIGATRRACDGPQDEIERDFLKALGATRTWQMRDGMLLLCADKVLARFKRADGDW